VTKEEPVRRLCGVVGWCGHLDCATVQEWDAASRECRERRSQPPQRDPVRNAQAQALRDAADHFAGPGVLTTDAQWDFVVWLRARAALIERGERA
jgi:hypothetical protein